MFLPSLLYSQAHDDCVSLDPAFPKDVSHFKSKRCSCYHFSGEFPYDSERKEFLEKAVREACTDLVKLQAYLIEKYKEDTNIVRELEQLNLNVAN